MTTVPTVLIAEDSETVRRGITNLLQPLGYRIEEAGNGAAAIRAIGMHHDIRIAVVDWNMPLVSGIEVCRYARSCQRFIYVLMLTSRPSQLDLACAFENGANDYIRKPFDPIELCARVRSAQRMCAIQDALTEAQRLETLGQLAAGVAHEINTPIQFVGDNLRFFGEVWQDLTAVLETLQPLARSLTAHEAPSAEQTDALVRGLKQADLAYLATEVPRALDQAHEGVSRITRIVRAMKDCGQIRSTEKVPANLNASIESTVILARNEWKYVAEVDLDLSPELPSIECDVGAINQVVLNLIVNAAHAISDGRSKNLEDLPGDGRAGAQAKGRIWIRTRAREDGVQVDIEDDGPGVPEEIQSRIFERFFTTKPIGKGTGQGLAIAREIVETGHGGRISCENRSEGGARFSLWLPIAASDHFETTATETHGPSDPT